MAYHDRWYSFDTDWEDRVAPIGEPLVWPAGDRQAFEADVRDIASAVVECTLAPLAGLIDVFPSSTAYEPHMWQRSLRGTRPRWNRI
jgi:hypothetical protein